MKPFLPLLLALTLPVAGQGIPSGQGLPERFKDNHAAWEESLDKGLSAPVRKATEELLQQESAAVNPSDYDAMHALVATRNLAARACVMEGAWEDAIAHLDKASQSATANAANAETTFAKLVSQHQEKLAQWRSDTAEQGRRLKALDDQPGLSSEQIKLRGQIRSFLDEHQKAIAQSEKSLKEINALLTLLKKEQETYAAALAQWKGFLAKERADIATVGTVNAYVVQKLAQVEADDAHPPTERLAYARRLLRLDAKNKDCQRFLDELEGQYVAPKSQPPAVTSGKTPKHVPLPATD